MVSEDESLVLVYNGEIYNFRELRDELESKGHRFRTECDTEVVLKAYEAYGDETVERFNGMFAFAVYDTRRKRLFVARDRLGIKPLYYTLQNGVFAYASELGALLRSGLISGKLNASAVDAYFTSLYIPCPDTIFSDVYKLRPGESLVVEKGEISRSTYWRPQFEPLETWTLDSAGERFLELLRDAIRLRLVSDVPLGAFLSGGVDSSTIVGLLSEVAQGPVRTFSIGFDDADANELPYARLAAERFETDHVEEVMNPDATSIAPQLAAHFGEPFADSSAIPTWLVSKLARTEVTVALTGDGGDELFAGYTWTRMNRHVAQARRVPKALRAAAAVALRMAPDNRRLSKFRRFIGDTFLTPQESFRRRQTCFDTEQRAALYGKDLAGELAGQVADRFQECAETSAELSDDDWMLYQDLRQYLPDDVLTKVDRMSMAVSLEARVPLLDHRLVEFAATVPFDLKLHGGRSKRLVKHAVKDLLPSGLLRERKRGFSIPIHRWFRESLGASFEEQVLSDDSACLRFLRKESIEALYKRHKAGRDDYGHHLWALFMFEHWIRYAESIPGVELTL